MKVVTVFGAPGHSSVHLQRGNQQLYWDPGGFYGGELDECLADFDEEYCERFGGFPWDRLKRSRSKDILTGDAASLLRILSIYHLDGDEKTQVFSFRLAGDLGQRAWHLLEGGGRKDSETGFDTDRNPMFCVKAVTEYLHLLGGDFRKLIPQWFPEQLSGELHRIGARPSHVYTLGSIEIADYIARVRKGSGLQPLRFVENIEEQKEEAW